MEEFKFKGATGGPDFVDKAGGQALSMTRGATSEAKSQGKMEDHLFSMSKGATGGAEFRSKGTTGGAEFRSKCATGGSEFMSRGATSGAEASRFPFFQILPATSPLCSRPAPVGTHYQGSAPALLRNFPIFQLLPGPSSLYSRPAPVGFPTKAELRGARGSRPRPTWVQSRP